MPHEYAEKTVFAYASKELMNSGGTDRLPRYVRGGQRVATIAPEDWDPRSQDRLYAGLEAGEITPQECKDRLDWIQCCRAPERWNCSASERDPEVWKKWNCCCFVDFDLKNWKGSEKVDADDVIRKMLYELAGGSKMASAIWFAQKSFSGRSAHFVFKFDCEPTARNFRVCSHAAGEAVKEATKIVFKDDAKEILASDVIDPCSKKPAQLLYLTREPLIWARVGEDGKPVCRGSSAKTAEKAYGAPDDRPEAAGAALVSVKGGGPLPLSARLVDAPLDSDGRRRGFHFDDRMQTVYVFLEYAAGDKGKYDVLAKNASEWISRQYAMFTGESRQPAEFRRFFEKKWRELRGGLKNYAASAAIRRVCRDVYGLRFDEARTFVPKEPAPLPADRTIELAPGEYLSKVFEEALSGPGKIVHLNAGCGLGKTRAVKEFAKSLRERWRASTDLWAVDNPPRGILVLPMNSIIYDSFGDEESRSYFKILNGANPGEPDADKWVVTTWDTLVGRRLATSWDYDYFIVDEIHASGMYGYRAKAARGLLSAIASAAARRVKKVVLMTGTPGSEIISNKWDMEKVRITRPDPPRTVELDFYEKSYWDWLAKDVKEWLGGGKKGRAALIFKDDANEDNALDELERRGIGVALFYSKRRAADVKRTLSKRENVPDGASLFTVYGQAGINLYARQDQKVRIYVLPDRSGRVSGMAAVQYLNRLRNGGALDLARIYLRRASICNEDPWTEAGSEEEMREARSRVDALNASGDDPSNSLAVARLGIPEQAAPEVGKGVRALDAETFRSLSEIERDTERFSTTQGMYEVLRRSGCAVAVKYLGAEPESEKADPRDRHTPFWASLKREQIKRDSDGRRWWELDEKQKSYASGPLRKAMSEILNRLVRGYVLEHANESGEKTADEADDWAFSEIDRFRTRWVAEEGKIKKSRPKQFCRVLEIIEHAGGYRDAWIAQAAFRNSRKAEREGEPKSRARKLSVSDASVLAAARWCQAPKDGLSEEARKELLREYYEDVQDLAALFADWEWLFEDRGLVADESPGKERLALADEKTRREETERLRGLESFQGAYAACVRAHTQKTKSVIIVKKPVVRVPNGDVLEMDESERWSSREEAMKALGVSQHTLNKLLGAVKTDKVALKYGCVLRLG